MPEEPPTARTVAGPPSAPPAPAAGIPPGVRAMLERTDAPPDEYLVYDRRTGTVLYRYSIHRAAPASRAAPAGAALLQQPDGSGVTTALTQLLGDRLPDVGIVLVDADQARSDCRVDPDTEQVLPRPRLVLSADRPALEGDGKDTTRISVTVVDGDGAVVTGCSHRVRVTTTRGKLSLPRGEVDLHDGAAEMSLRSVDETVPAVRLRAESMDGDCAPGRLTLEFR